VRIPPKDFRKGEDQFVIYHGMTANARARVLMQLLGKKTRATIDLHVLDHA
jgi:hypothetical protein